MKPIKIFKYIIIATFAILFLITIYSFATSKSIKVETLTIESSDLPISFDNYRIAIIADIHLGLYIKKKDLDIMLNILEEQKPDAVFIVGDHIYSAPSGFNYHNTNYLNDIKDIFVQIADKYPTYAVNGNHDNHENKNGIIDITVQSDISHLDNKYAWLTNKDNTNERIYISGVGDLDTDIINLDFALQDVSENDFNILLSHNPKVIEQITNNNYDKYVDLMLAGHTHGGQINIAPIVDIAFHPAHKYGLKQYGQTKLYVTSGIGMAFLPIRFNAKAEIAIIELKK